HARETLEALARKHRRGTTFEFVRKSVVQLLKGRSKTTVPTELNGYDVVYSAGLFDYLPDSVCRQLVGVFYERLAPGGLVIVTNVEPSNPIRHWLSYLLDWHLIYRNAAEMLELCPGFVPRENVRVVSDPTGVNVFMEIRRPAA